MSAERPYWLDDLHDLAEELQETDDQNVLAGRSELLLGETIKDVRARVAARESRPTLTLIRGGRDDAN